MFLATESVVLGADETGSFFGAPKTGTMKGPRGSSQGKVCYWAQTQSAACKGSALTFVLSFLP